MESGLKKPVAEIFESKRLVFRAITSSEEDKATFNDLIGEPGTDALGNSGIPLPSNRDVWNNVAKKLSDSSLLSAFVCHRYDTTHADAGQAIGVINLSKPSLEVKTENCVTKMGIFMAEASRRQGFAEEAVRWAIDWTFNYTRVHRFELQSSSYNTAAIKLWQKIGFTLEGRKRECVWFQRKWHDSLMFSLLEHEWDAMQGGNE
ncbi:hypothetical protein NQ176_g4871 [Zarea fungicola]|uniref:Uncharacterized protein n=1 Tax=Zarea fungicola TaxID=93591 RepID=A0ACC1ND73_9HYPO|nr:hypothetical protein NQ176_g4871 [Lecanicillium fungicola]